jgi:hypothetical protein
VKDIWSGVGTFTYNNRNPYRHVMDIQPNAGAIKANLPGSDTGSCGDCTETHLLAAFSVASGEGPSATGCSNVSSYQGRPSCAGSPAGPDGVGYPCFRPNALPVILLATDEPPSTQYSCPGFNKVSEAANAIGAKIVGVRGESEGGGEGAQVQQDLATLALATGAVDAQGAALVLPGANSGAAAAIETGIRTLSNSLPLDIAAVPVDDGTDSIDAVTSFIDHLVTLQSDSAECSSGLAEQDSNQDGFADVFVDVIAGTPVCWKLVPKTNKTVSVEDEPKIFRATIQVYGDRVTLLDERNVFFVVPPKLTEVL